MLPKITIVTVCYNCEADIERTIESVISQTYSNLEYIIIDGASNDGTMDIANRYADRITKVVSEPDKGIYDAMNKGIKLATGEWINFMNVGDVFHGPQTIEKVFQNYVDCGESIVYGRTKVIDRGNNKVIFQGFSALDYMPTHHQAIFTRTSEMKAHPFNLKYKIIADAEFFYRLYKRNPKHYKVDTIVVDYDNSGLSSFQEKEMLKEQIVMYLSSYNFFKALDVIYTLIRYRNVWYEKNNARIWNQT